MTSAAAGVRLGDLMDDGTIYAGISPDTSEPMYTTTGDAAVRCTFNEAVAIVRGLNAANHLGHDDWRVPSHDELNVMFNHRVVIGAFNTTDSNTAQAHYWSSTEGYKQRAWAQRFSDGTQGWHYKSGDASLRCVRG